jgi:hypothetical protein
MMKRTRQRSRIALDERLIQDETRRGRLMAGEIVNLGLRIQACPAEGSADQHDAADWSLHCCES